MKKFVIVLITIYVLLMTLLFIYFKPFMPGDSSIVSMKPKRTADKVNKKVIKFVAPLIDSAVWLKAKEGFDAASKEYGFYGVWAGADDHSANKMLSELEAAIDEKVDGIVLCPFSPPAFTSALERAEAAGIPVIALAVDTEEKRQRAAFIGTDSEECGRLQAEALYEKVGDNMRIGVMMTNLDSMNQVIQVNVLKKFISRLNNSKILSIEEERGDYFTAMEVLNRMMDSNPDINCIFCTEGPGLPGIANLIAKRGLQDRLTVIGMDTTAPNLDAIREGTIYGVMSQDFYSMGFLGGKYAFMKTRGETIPEITYTKTELVTKQNLDKYQ